MVVPHKSPWQRLLGMPRRAREVLRGEGFCGLRSHLVDLLGEISRYRLVEYRRTVLVVRAVGEPIPTAAARIPVEIALLKRSEVDEYAAFHPDTNAPAAHRRLDLGHQCFVARHQGAIVNACWTGTGSAWIPYLQCRIDLAPGEAYVYDHYTDPRFRGNNVPFVRAVFMLHHFRALGYHRLTAIVIPENRPAFGSFEKSGYHRIGIIGTLRVGPWRYHRMSAWHQRERLLTRRTRGQPPFDRA